MNANRPGSSAPALMKPVLGDAQGSTGNLHHHQPDSRQHPRDRACKRLPKPSLDLDHLSTRQRPNHQPPQCTIRRL
ncbi:hypothetical protein HPB50_021277 [Hyalomma asiaticum]|uniref:Uncharacterized protein n=1 Tax=Hyalomma asiaticum TaxID=266040 RepID=A0ACB7S598_HYAAI|nr:hypothetical protein HPB50_021277 [Hyalomma asiaticum]